ncbi:MAG: ABC transporter permease [Spirochaetes bacterium]|nr:ABC transporter permease [Spirochaetota bacterium]MBU1079113.1 ABC transporter permease [Spirochaetota bacterium]
MGTLFKIAWRNVWRHGKRTALTIVTMAFGLGLYIGMDSLLKGMDRGGLDNIVNLSDSSVRVTTAKYEEERRSFPLEYGLADPAGLEAYIKKDPRVEAVSLRTRFVGSMSNGTDSIPVMAVAVDPALDAEVFTLTDFVEGSWFGDGGERDVVLGYGLAEDLGLRLGDWVTLSARTRYEAQNADDFRVIGLIDSTEPGINNSGVYVEFADAEEFIELEGLRTEVVVKMARRVNLKDAMADSDALAAAIERDYPELSAVSFGEVGRSFLELAKAKSKSIGMIIVVMMLIAGIGIANTILMSVYSRVREIGVLRAFGFTPKEISRLFLIEGGIIGFVGSLAGVVMGLALDLYMIYVGFDLDAMLKGADMGIPIWGTLRGEWNPSQFAVIVVVGVAVALISSRSPARRASRMEVTNALRFV